MTDEQKQIDELKKQIAKIELLIGKLSKQETVNFFHIEHLNVDGPFADKLNFMFDKIDVKEVSGALNLGNNFGVKASSKKQTKKQSSNNGESSSQHDVQPQSSRPTHPETTHSSQSQIDNNDIGQLSSLMEAFQLEGSSSKQKFAKKPTNTVLKDKNKMKMTVRKQTPVHSNKTSQTASFTTHPNKHHGSDPPSDVHHLQSNTHFSSSSEQNISDQLKQNKKRKLRHHQPSRLRQLLGKLTLSLKKMRPNRIDTYVETTNISPEQDVTDTKNKSHLKEKEIYRDKSDDIPNHNFPSQTMSHLNAQPPVFSQTKTGLSIKLK